MNETIQQISASFEAFKSQENTTHIPVKEIPDMDMEIIKNNSLIEMIKVIEIIDNELPNYDHNESVSSRLKRLLDKKTRENLKLQSEKDTWEETCGAWESHFLLGGKVEKA